MFIAASGRSLLALEKIFSDYKAKMGFIAENGTAGVTVEVLNPPWDQPDAWAWLRDKEPVRLMVKGSGYGHGVGLSQWGAKGMADAGFNERQILEYYYKGVRIVSLDEIQ